jgi:hypothetical protein
VSDVIEIPGVRKKNVEAETCWSEAEIPSEAKRQRGTLQSEILNPQSQIKSPSKKRGMK